MFLVCYQTKQGYGFGFLIETYNEHKGYLSGKSLENAPQIPIQSITEVIGKCKNFTGLYVDVKSIKGLNIYNVVNWITPNFVINKKPYMWYTVLRFLNSNTHLRLWINTAKRVNPSMFDDSFEENFKDHEFFQSITRPGFVKMNIMKSTEDIETFEGFLKNIKELKLLNELILFVSTSEFFHLLFDLLN